jgi:hypothetical protein
MAATITYSTTPPTVDTTFASQTVYGQIVLTGSYTQTGTSAGTTGETLNFSTHATGVINYLVSNQRPSSVLFWEEPAAGTLPTGLSFFYRNLAAKPSSANGVLQITGASTINSSGVTTAGFELAAGAYPTILTATIIKFRAFFPLGR